ncbi:unnamed protein product, partial [Ectocarpus sp. 8 AP-2014]
HIVCTQAPVCSTPTITPSAHTENSTHFFFRLNLHPLSIQNQVNGSGIQSSLQIHAKARNQACKRNGDKNQVIFQDRGNHPNHARKNLLYHLSPAPSQPSFVYLLIV